MLQVGSVENNNNNTCDHRGAAVAPPPSGALSPNEIQMKYIENMIKDAHEETM